MNRAIAVSVILWSLCLTHPVGAQQKSLAILKATVPGFKSEARAIGQDQLQQLYDQRLSPHELFKFNHQADLDTIQYSDLGNIEWKVANAESLLCFFDPPAPCYIKAVGIQVRRGDSDKFCDVFEIRLAKANYRWDFAGADWQGDSLFLGVWKNHVWQGNQFDPPLGRLMWGDFPVTAVENTVCWTEMVWLGEEPDTGGEPFHVVIMPSGEIGSSMATLATGLEPNYSRDNIKLAQYRDTLGWFVYNYVLNWYVVVEYYGNRPPQITFDRAGSTLELGPRVVTCVIIDEDVTDASKAGVREAFLHFSINRAAYDSVALQLKNGTIENGNWAAEIPGPRTAGDLVTYYFSATDRGSPARYSMTHPVTYRIFEKQQELLLIVSGQDLKSFFPLLEYRYDYWDTGLDGPIFDQLVQQYHHIIQCDEAQHLFGSDDVIGHWIGTGAANEPRNYFFSSTYWGVDMAAMGKTFGPNDWHNAYLGIESLDSFARHGDPWSALPLNAVAGDIVSGKIAEFCADSLQLYYPSSAVAVFTPTRDAAVCFWDSASGQALGCHKEGEAFKTAFLSFDYRFLFTRPQFWITYHFDNLLGRVLEWFGTPVSQVAEKKADPPTAFRLYQNYPNPFNSQTVIEYGILKPAHVQLTIFNLAGETVARLIDGYQRVGRFRIVWKAQGYPSGIYYCRLKVDGSSQTAKMILIN